MKTQKDINFAKKVLEGLKIPPKGMVKFYDTKEKGLGLYITATGHKSFFIKKCINNQQKVIVIGPFPAMSVELARKKAQEIKLQIAMGENPLEEKEKRAKEKTLGEAYREYMEKHAKAECKPRSQKDIELHLRKVLALWNQRELSSIARQEVRDLHERIGKENGKIEANRVLTYICAIYNKMISWDWEGANPTIGIKKFKETKRDRFILKDELPRFMEALKNEPNRDMKDFFLMCLYTGARKGNALSMRWEDVDFSINEWRIPNTKNGEPVRVPLIGQVLEILNDRIHLKESSPWVFPSSDGSKSGHIQEPKTAWKRIIERAGLENLRIHDLRRTCGSYQAIAGVPIVTIGKSLGHKSIQSTAIYARLSNDPVRVGLESAFSFMNERG
jgi:integrase